MSDAPSSDSDQRSHPTNDDSDQVTDDEETLPPSEILANKKACPLFSGLHRSKGTFWLATRPFQMGSWSTAGAMLTLGSEMPWFCQIPDEDWQADEQTMISIKADFEGPWCDRRQEIVFIGEGLDVKGLTKALDECLLGKKEMKEWELVMRDKALSEEEKEERLMEMWDDELWAEWPRMEDAEHDEHDGHDHSHPHRR